MTAPQARQVAAPARGFDFTQHVRRVCVDMTERLVELSHVDMAYVAIRYCQTRCSGPYGIQASLTPLRFLGGARDVQRRGSLWTIEPLRDSSGREMLYLLSFYLPRFLDLSFAEKLATICHELWHIGPRFDGDLRRHKGRCYAHGHSEKLFHAAMHALAARYESLGLSESVSGFLRCSFRELEQQHGRVYGLRVRTPRAQRKRS